MGRGETPTMKGGTTRQDYQKPAKKRSRKNLEWLASKTKWLGGGKKSMQKKKKKKKKKPNKEQRFQPGKKNKSRPQANKESKTKLIDQSENNHQKRGACGEKGTEGKAGKGGRKKIAKRQKGWVKSQTTRERKKIGEKGKLR